MGGPPVSLTQDSVIFFLSLAWGAWKTIFAKLIVADHNTLYVSQPAMVESLFSTQPLHNIFVH